MTNTYCVNAIHGLSINTSGTVKTCCMAENDLPKKTISNYRIIELFEDEFFKKIRSDLNDGIRNPNCKKCWDEEDAGRKSKRLRDNEALVVKSDVDLQILEVNLGNLCNIKCRTCGPWSSNQWIKEDYDIYKAPDVSFVEFQDKWKVYKIPFDDDSLFWKSLEEVLPGIIQFDFYGGEPFLSKKQWGIVKKSVDNGYSKDLKIKYNTNGTIWDESQIDLLSKMRIADVAFSIDGIGERFEFMRYPAEWSVVESHLQKAKEWSKIKDTNIFTICYTISILNIWYINEMVEYCDKNDISLYLNLVHYPEHYNIQNLPTDLKTEVEQHLMSTIDQTHHIWYWINGILKFMNQREYNKLHWDNFLSITKKHDVYRKQDFSKVFPEFYARVKKYDE